ncbi:S53 family peptidase [Dictyobacter formicarum]|uniref:Peptidase S53 domain-containing protein n=1 Tax=Dictyobacter formicarum TaxID=2778368 RepID=A0ABQ3VC64_9CHLR|nr:S53 family peptidase [Dictyobacter formicarum]GHO82786.1 hypothetical protein KSZ_07920 [Dictyobacter formicarum]
MKHVLIVVVLVVLNFVLAFVPLFTVRFSASASIDPVTDPVTTRWLDAQPITHDIPLDKEAVLVNQKQFACLVRLTPPRCYTPQQIRQAYHIQPLLEAGITGKGQTIAIIGFFHNPNLYTDLHIFDQLFGLPDPHLSIFAPLGLTPFDSKNPKQSLAAQEINLDVEWAHAIAPEAAINLVLSKSAGFEDLYITTRFAIQHNLGDVITQSYGFPETAIAISSLRKEHALFETARARGISVFASSGDRGPLEPIFSDDLSKIIAFGPGVQYPASDPLVTSVGGTNLSLLPSGIYQHEEVWSNRLGSTGGGFSRRFLRPSYQDGFVGASRTRGVPDVAYVGDPTTGVPIIFTLKTGPSFIPIGGTSAGTPQWAALAALGNQLAGRRLGFLNPSLYSLSKNSLYSEIFHDILTGSNSLTVQVLKSTVTFPGYNAKQGWDPATGLGSPVAFRLLTALVQSEAFQPVTLSHANKPLSSHAPLQRRHYAFNDLNKSRRYTFNDLNKPRRNKKVYRQTFIRHYHHRHLNNNTHFRSYPNSNNAHFRSYHVHAPRSLTC